MHNTSGSSTHLFQGGEGHAPASRTEFLAFGRPDFGDQEIAAIARVMRSGWVGMGHETLLFERELAAFLGAPHVVTVSSCTSALFLSLLVLGIGQDDEVICPSLTWCSTANAALYLGARPVFCDVDPVTLGVTPDTILRQLTPRTRAVIPVHMGGLAVDVDALRAALPSRVHIVEDAAHALGSEYSSGGRVGSAGHLCCFSFYANKNLSTGEGGAIALSQPDLADRLRSLRQHGLSTDAWKRYTHPDSVLGVTVKEVGHKANYTDLQAAIGRVQLERQAEFARRRREIAARYVTRLAEAPVPIRVQANIEHAGHARHLFQVVLPLERLRSSRNDLLLALRRQGIGASVHYVPLHRMPVYQRYARAPLPATDGLANRILTLPIGASMTIADADGVAACVLDWLERDRAAQVAS